MSERALLVTPVPAPEALAAACALTRIEAQVVPSDIGSVAVCVDAGGEAPLEAGRTLSQLLKGALLVVLRHTGGQVEATGFQDGARTEIQAVGLWLDAAPALLEELLLGQVQPQDVEGVVSSVGMSRWRAARNLAKLARAGRKQARRG